MAFDPLAFLKPKKAVSMEGLLSRDMFEKFASDNSGSSHSHQNVKSRVYHISSYATEKADEIIDWLNVWECIEITMGQAVLIISGNSDSNWDNLYVRHLDDQILSKSEIVETMNLIRKELLNKIHGITITNVKNTTDTGTIMYRIDIRRDRDNSRPQLVTDDVSSRMEQIVKWANQWNYLCIYVTCAGVTVYGLIDSDSFTILWDYDLEALLTEEETMRTAVLIRSAIIDNTNNLFATDIQKECVDEIGMYNFVLARKPIARVD